MGLGFRLHARHHVVGIVMAQAQLVTDLVRNGPVRGCAA
jgi:hypothetical protein